MSDENKKKNLSIEELRKLTPEERRKYNEQYKQFAIYLWAAIAVGWILDALLGIFGVVPFSPWLYLVAFIAAVHCTLYYHDMFYLDTVKYVGLTIADKFVKWLIRILEKSDDKTSK